MSEYRREMDETTMDNVTDQAIYNMVMYMPLDKLDIKKGNSIEYIINIAKTNKNNVDIDEGVLQSLIEFQQNNPDSDVLKARISNMSYTSDNKLIQNPDAFSAAVFTDTDGNKSVNFRGTPGKAWMDNADGLSGTEYPPYELEGNQWKYLSAIDKATLDYYQWIRKELKQSGKDITIGGHSKGGHEALLISLLFSDDISACYAFDGQSISPEMWAEIKELYKDDPEKLQKIRDKITAVNLDNDYVHVLGWTEEDGYIAQNVYVIQGSENCLVNPLANHFMQAFFNGKGALNPISEEGEGPLAKFLLQVSDRIMKLESPEREKVARSVMMILQFAHGKKWPVNFTAIDMVEVLADLDDGMETAVDILTDVMNNTEEGKAIVEYLKSLPAGGKIQELLAEAHTHPLIANAALTVLSGIIKLVLAVSEKVISAAEIVVFLKEAGQAIVNVIQSAAQWIYETGSAIVEGIKHKVLETGRLMMDFAHSAGAAVADIAEQTRLLLQYQLNKAAQWVESTTQSVLTFVSDLAERFQQTFVTLKNRLAQVKQGLIRTGEEIVRAADSAKEKIEGFAVSVKEQITAAVKMGRAALNQGMDQIISELKNGPINDIREAANTLSVTLEAAQRAVFESVDKMKDSIVAGFSILTAAIAGAGGWLKEKGAAGFQVTGSLIKGDMTGKAGIDYTMLEEALIRIDDFISGAVSLEREIDYVLSDLSGLRYASVSASHLIEAGAQVSKQRSFMEQHSIDLKNYKNMCCQTEAEFIQALSSYA